MYRWIFFNGPLWITIFCVTFLMGMLTLSVMREEKALIAMHNESILRNNAEEQGDYVSGNNENVELNEFNRRDLAATNTNGSHQSHENESFNENDANSSEGGDVERRSSNNKRHPTLHREASFKLERTKRIFRQAFLYVGICYVTWFIPTMGVLIARTNQDALIMTPPFFILVVMCIFQPMQGFWNSLGK